MVVKEFVQALNRGMGHGEGSKKSGNRELYKDKQGMYRGKWAEDHGPGANSRIYIE
jgi:hypothetical protein